MKLKPGIIALKSDFEKVIEETVNTNIRDISRRRVLILKTNDSRIDKTYHLMACLNT